jgi:hypothetical protein
MQTTIKNILNELHTSNTRMLVLNSDNAMLISYFKFVNENIIYLNELINMETKYDWLEVENSIKELEEKDEQLTHININFQIRELNKKNEAFLTLKGF